MDFNITKSAQLSRKHPKKMDSVLLRSCHLARLRQLMRYGEIAKDAVPVHALRADMPEYHQGQRTLAVSSGTSRAASKQGSRHYRAPLEQRRCPFGQRTAISGAAPERSGAAKRYRGPDFVTVPSSRAVLPDRDPHGERAARSHFDETTAPAVIPSFWEICLARPR